MGADPPQRQLKQKPFPDAASGACGVSACTALHYTVKTCLRNKRRFSEKVWSKYSASHKGSCQANTVKFNPDIVKSIITLLSRKNKTKEINKKENNSFFHPHRPQFKNCCSTWDQGFSWVKANTNKQPCPLFFWGEEESEKTTALVTPISKLWVRMMAAKILLLNLILNPIDGNNIST